MLDLWKDLYIPSFDLIYPKLADGALIVATTCCIPTSAPRREPLPRARPRAGGMTTVLLPVGHGIELSRYR